MSGLTRDVYYLAAENRFLGHSITMSELIRQANPAKYVGQIATGLRLPLPDAPELNR